MNLKRVLQLALSFAILAQPLNPMLVQEATASMSSEGFLLVNLAEESVHKPMKTINARVTIDAPPILVWQTLTSYNKLKDFIPGYEKTHIISDDGCNKVLEVAMSVARFMPVYQYRIRVNENRKAFELKFNRISGDMNHLAASYQLYPKNNGTQTILVYNLQVNPGSRFPDFTINPILKSNTERTMKAIQQYAEQEHKKTLIGQR